jgi:hypothetical protein
VALWDKSGQGGLDAGGTPIFPGLTHCCRKNGKRKPIPEIGDVFVRLFQQLGQQQRQQQQQKENVDDQDPSNFRGLLNDDASTKDDFRQAVRSVLGLSPALPSPASPSSSPAHKKPKGSVECDVARQVHDDVVDLTGDDAPSGAQPVVASAPKMATARLSNIPAVQTKTTKITKFFKRVQKSQEKTRGSSPRTTTPADRTKVDWGEDDDDLDDDDLEALPVDWGEDDEVDWEALFEAEAEHLQGQMSGVAIDVDGTEGTRSTTRTTVPEMMRMYDENV